MNTKESPKRVVYRREVGGDAARKRCGEVQTAMEASRHATFPPVSGGFVLHILSTSPSSLKMI